MTGAGSTAAGRPRRWMMRMVIGAAIVVSLYGLAWFATPYSGVARAIVWLGADTGDIDRFPARAIGAGDDPWHLTATTLDVPITVELDGRVHELDDLLEATGTEAFLVVRGEELVYERYFHGRGRDDLHTSFSVAKSVLSAVVGAAVAEGHLGVDDAITEHLPELLARDPRFAEVSVRDLITMSSGLVYTERSLPWSDDALTYYAADLRGLALDRSRVSEPPGTFHYNNYNPLLMGLILERATGEPVTGLMERYLWKPLGAEGDASWSLDSVRSGFEKLESGVNARPIDLLRFGMLYRDGGRRGDVQVLPADWVAASTSAQLATPLGLGYGYWWWIDDRDGSASDGFLAWGNHGQFIHVAPDLDTVIVRLGSGYGIDAHSWPAVLRQLAEGFAA